MKPLPSETDAWGGWGVEGRGVGRAVGGSPSGLCPTTGKEVRSQVFLQGKHSPCPKAGAVATLASPPQPWGPEQMCRVPVSGCSSHHLQEAGNGG